MKILLVRPEINRKITTVRNFMFGEPLGIECLSTILKEQGHEVLIVDFMAESKRHFKKYMRAYNPDVVGFTSQCSDVVNILLMAKEVKAINRDIIVLAGGVQATISPEAYFDENIDYVFKTTTRENVKELMAQMQDHTVEEIMGVYSKTLDYASTIPSCRNEYAKADRASTAKYRKKYKYVGYQPCAVLQTSYGCRNQCAFCVKWKLEGAEVIELPIGDVVDEIASLAEPHIMICDNDFLVNEERLLAFLDLVETKGIKKTFICYGSVNSILGIEYLFDRLSKNGLKAVIVGYESFDDEQLRKWNKSATTDENYKATQILKKSGIACWGSVILHPDFSKEDFKKLKKYHKRLQPELETFSPLVPHPLTPLYEEYKDRLIYKKEDYEKWNFGDVVIYPSKMSLKQYYIQVLLFGMAANLNWHSLKYTVKAFPLKNTLRMLFGFNQSVIVYIKNILLKKNNEGSITIHAGIEGK